MTPLSTRKSRLCFIAEDTVRYRSKLRRVVVEVDRDGYAVNLRLEGTRQRFPLSFAAMYNQAVKIEVDRQRAAKKAKRK